MTASRTVIIVGSSRKGGDTYKAAEVLKASLGADLIELIDFRIGHYHYEHNQSDDFRPLIARIISDYDTLVFATPVYWYAMSGVMKDFLDRITDLLDIDKELGRRLRGKKMAVITSSAGDHLGDDFWHPFRATGSYLGMSMLGNIHTLAGEDLSSVLTAFATLLNAHSA
jgi:multimeric flavodoxin WrbA